jgi:protein-disulfide isomerase
MKNNDILILIAAIFTILGFLALAYKFTSTPDQVYFEQAKVIREDDHVKWSNKKKHVLVEYSDLQCPACKSFHDQIKIMEQDKQITDNITFVYRHYPLDTPHPHAREAAYAAEAAGKQKKFFEMADIIFENQDTWAKSDIPQDEFFKYATELKLDLPQYKKDFASQAIKDRVQKDAVAGNEFQVNSTPTFFLNGNKVEVTTFAEFQELLKKTAEQK